jgi:glycosyltransferase involved in cell wall biosynthesis
MTDPVCSVVIPTYDAEATLGAQLDALARQRFDGTFEVVVADNGSTDGSAALARSYVDRLPLLRVVDASRAQGVSVARNEGVRAARTDLLLVCDADDVVEDGWVAAIVAALTEHDFVGGVLHGFGEPGAAALTVPFAEGMDALPTAFGRRPYAVGANMGFRRWVFEVVGGFDETFPAGAEEVDFAWRAADHGAVPQLVPDAVVHYRARVGFRRLAQQRYQSGLGTAHLIAKLDPAGVPTRSWQRRIRHEARLVRLFPWRGGRDARMLWATALAYELGVVLGAVRFRRPMP